MIRRTRCCCGVTSVKLQLHFLSVTTLEMLLMNQLSHVASVRNPSGSNSDSGPCPLPDESENSL